MKKLIYGGIGLLVVYNIYVTYTLIKVKDTFSEFHLLYSSVQENAQTQSEYIKEVNEIRIQEMYVNNNKMNSGLTLSDKTGKSMSIIDIFDRKKLIFRFADSYCTPCINKYLSRLKKSQTNTECNDIILLVASNDKQSFFKNFNTDEFKVFFVDNLNFIEYDKKEKPYFFTVSKDLVIRDCYIPDESQLDLLETFLIRQLSLLSLN